MKHQGFATILESYLPSALIQLIAGYVGPRSRLHISLSKGILFSFDVFRGEDREMIDQRRLQVAREIGLALLRIPEAQSGEGSCPSLIHASPDGVWIDFHSDAVTNSLAAMGFEELKRHMKGFHIVATPAKQEKREKKEKREKREKNFML